VRPAVSSRALSVGRAVHRGLELLALGKTLTDTLAAVTTECVDVDHVDLARVRAMIRGHHARWSPTAGEWAHVAPEQEFGPIPLGLGTVKGKRDEIMRHVTSGKFIREYKTSSEDIANVTSDFWLRIAIDAQVELYRWATASDCQIIYDVIRKPAGGPVLKKKIARRKDESDESLAARKEAVRETIEEYEDRLVSEMAADPGKWLVRRVIHRTREQSEAIIEELRETVDEIETYRGLFPRNESACRSRFGTCVYLGVCGGTESLDSERFVKLETAHPELESTEEYDDCPL
jgi:hypothetical protein